MKKFPDLINDELSVKHRLEWVDKFKGYAFNFDLNHPVTPEHVLLCVQSLLSKSYGISYGYSPKDGRYICYSMIFDRKSNCMISKRVESDSILNCTIELCLEIEKCNA